MIIAYQIAFVKCLLTKNIKFFIEYAKTRGWLNSLTRASPIVLSSVFIGANTDYISFGKSGCVPLNICSVISCVCATHAGNFSFNSSICSAVFSALPMAAYRIAVAASPPRLCRVLLSLLPSLFCYFVLMQHC